MTTTRTQVTMRLAADLVQDMDTAVGAGEVSSRASYVEGALRRERRERLVRQEIALLASLHGEDPQPELAAMFVDPIYPDFDA